MITMDSKNAIEIRNITKSFKIEVEDPDKKRSLLNKNPKKTVVNTVIDDLSLNVRKGDVLGVLGRNGSGKSTFLSIVARIMEPDSGTIERSGKIASILELGMGFHPDMSGRENIYLKGELYGFSRADMDSRIEKIIDYSGIRKYIDNPVRTYSSGMSGRLAFAVMVNVESDIMLVDEVLSVGDAAFTAKAKEHFKKLAKSGKTVIFVSHAISEMAEMCNRCIWIENGKIVKDGNAKTVCAEYQNKMSSSPEIISDLAEAGVAESQYQLAMMYRDGISGFGKSEELYREWMKRASDQGHTLAQVVYADILMGEENTSEAFSLYTSAANKGNNDAKMKISSFRNRKKDKLGEIVKEIYLKMAETGEPVHQFRCADYLLKSAWTDDEKKVAFDWFMKSADQGYPNALHQIGIMYRDGLGVARDFQKMTVFLEKASNLGFVPSLNLLADIYFQGKLVPKNDKKAFELYLKAAELGNGRCQYQVAIMYQDGSGTELNTEKADQWFERFSHSSVAWNYLWAADWARMYYDPETVKAIYFRAAEGGIPVALENIIHIDASAGIDCSFAFEKLKSLADYGNADALVRIGNIYYDAVGTKRDYSKALYNYVQATNLGNVWCLSRLGDMHKDGKGTECNCDEAILFYKRASNYVNTNTTGAILGLIQASLIDKNQLFDEYLSILKKLAKNGVVDAMKRVGNMYYEGINVKRNYSESLIWFEMASRIGDRWSQIRTADMYREGKGTTVNQQLAAKQFLS